MPGSDVTLGNRKQTAQPGFRGKQVIATAVQRVCGHRKPDRQQLFVRVEQKAEIHGHRHLGRRSGQPAQPWVGWIIRRAVQPVQQPVSPECGIGVGPVDGCGQGLRQSEQLGPVSPGADCTVKLVQHRVGRPADRCPQQQQHISQSGQGRPWRSFRPLSTRLRHRQQMPGQIAAVDRGYIGRVQHPQIAGVIPVIEMPAKPGHRAHSVQRLFKPVQSVGLADPAHVMCCHGGQQIQPDIGGRGAPGQSGARGFLKVVGGQEIVGPGHMGFKIAPGAAGNQAQALHCGGGQGLDRSGPVWPTDHPGQHWGQRPQQAKRRDQPPVGRSGQ